MNIVLKLPSTLHSTRVCAWLGLAISSRIDARAQWTNKVQYVATQKHVFFRVIISIKFSTSAVSMFGYIDVN